MPKIFKRNCDNCGIYYEKQNDKFCNRVCSDTYLPRLKVLGESMKRIGNKPPSRKGIRFTAEQRKKRGEIISYQFKVGIRKVNPESTKKLIANRGSGSKGKSWKLSLEIRKKFSDIKREFFKNIVKSSPIKEVIRKSLEYRLWRENVFERDFYTCRECKEKGKVLNADHFPVSFSEIIKEYKIKSFQEALRCEKLWDINNGRTLCIGCHKKTPNYLVNRKGNIVKELNQLLKVGV